MSTDKTLADVQPGGRVRMEDGLMPCPFCGNDAEFVPYKNNGLTLKCKSMGCIQRHQRTLRYGIDWLRTSMTEHWNARALPAQPSPAGQGDALELLERYDWAVSALDAELNEGWDEDGRRARLQSDRDEVRAELIAALAARQPVGEPDFFMVRDEDESRWRESDEATFDSVKRQRPDDAIALYTAPPAQQADQEYLESLDRALEGVIDQRDRYHEVADDLAGHIAAITGVDIGEHSSANCPWQNAIEAAEEYEPAQAVDLNTVRYALDAAEGLAVACASVDGFSREELASAGREMRKQFADARVLIDSQAMGK